MTDNDFLQVRNICKHYGGTPVLKDVSFSARQGEVHAIVGENGAGKSTLMKILSGAVQKDSGEILLDGLPVVLNTPFSAHRLGIRTVYQEFSLIRHLTITENMLLGQLPAHKVQGVVDWDKAHQIANEKLTKLGFTGLNVRSLVSQLSVPHQQMVEIAKSAVTKPRVWILDEPSAVLSQEELKRLFALIRKFKKESVLILYISHRMDEIFEIADRITVLRDGEYMGTVNAKESNDTQIIKMMVGRTLGEIYPKRSKKPADEILAVANLCNKELFENVSFSLARGEILGLFGLVGSGRTQVARSIFGADPVTNGEIKLEGKVIKPKSPQETVQLGIALLTEDRKRDGLVMSCSIRDNASLATMRQVSTWGVLDIQKCDGQVQTMVKDLSIHPSQTSRLVRHLSGGNQQKVILAKWLLAKAKVLILDEPTRGVDVATKVEIYKIISDLAEKGVGILLISSELPEILGMSDRALVMREGRMVGEFKRSQANEEVLLACAAGVVNE